MKKNMGNADRLIRILIAAVVIALVAMNIVTGVLGIVLIVLSIVFLLTSIVSFCPLYTLFGGNTCPKESK